MESATLHSAADICCAKFTTCILEIIAHKNKVSAKPKRAKAGNDWLSRKCSEAALLSHRKSADRSTLLSSPAFSDQHRFGASSCCSTSTTTSVSLLSTPAQLWPSMIPLQSTGLRFTFSFSALLGRFLWVSCDSKPSLTQIKDLISRHSPLSLKTLPNSPVRQTGHAKFKHQIEEVRFG